ncbi:DegT/DnrJ/EryC1/StrS family aminotransferase [Massilia sp.]|uniref:DegT/DnrJ/EryC1/StrS family aminotransferase n=1 Tax=Massilia sp. TaxID=1882437 RepID=UPI00289F6773|nr:DegT/DnrJ/EryC1/StrS family aminotransferase [Massilia sp.]
MLHRPSPAVRAPIAPVLSRAAFGPRSGAGSPLPALTDLAATRLVTSGRVALALALRCAGVTNGDTVLTPSWHSLSMLGPVQDRGASARFYRIGQDTAPDLEHARTLLDATVKALVVVHYYGFVQDLAPARAFCDAHGLALIEDCAHAFFGQRDGRAIGASGDYAVGSSMKFFPIYEGGCLASQRHALDGVVLRGAGAGFEGKAMLATLETSFRHGRLPLLRAALRPALALKDMLWNAAKARRPQQARALTPDSSDSGFGFDPWWLERRSSLFSRLVLRLASRDRIVALRRANYLRLEQALNTLPGCRPLYPALPGGACPWQFPLLFDHPEPVFAQLVAQGVPVVRFGRPLAPQVNAALCPHGVAFSERVLALPCHQELSESELDWIIERVRAAVAPA